MKKIHGDTKNRVLGLCMLIATLVGSAVAKADAVLDWNVIAVNTAVTNGQNPFAQARSRGNRTTRCIRIRERHHGRVSSLSRYDRSTARCMPRGCSHPSCLSRA